MLYFLCNMFVSFLFFTINTSFTCFCCFSSIYINMCFYLVSLAVYPFVPLNTQKCLKADCCLAALN